VAEITSTLALSKEKNKSSRSQLKFDPENPNAPVTLIVTDNTTVSGKTTGITKTYTQNEEGQFVDSTGAAWSGEYDQRAAKVRTQMGQKINESASDNVTREAWNKNGRATGLMTKDEGNAGGGDGKDAGEPVALPPPPFKIKSVSRKSYGNLKYPVDKLDGQDYTKITMYKYEPGKFKPGKDARPNNRITQSLGTTILPIPPSLTDDNGTNWNGHTMNALQAAGGQALIDVMDSGNFATAAGEELSELITKAQASPGLKTMGKALALGNIPGLGANTSQALGRSQGAMINPNEELLFNGPTMRNRSYGWRLTPRNREESQAVMNIIRFFKQGMAAQVSSNGGLFLKTPNVFHVQFFAGNGKEHPFIGKLKKAALVSMTVNYVPDGTYMTLPDNSMTAYDLGLNFGELEAIFEDDYSMSTNDIGY